MARVLVAGWVDVPAEKREQALQDAKPYIEAALAEPGCEAYSWSADPYDPKRIHVFESWTREEDLIFHLSEAPYRDMAGHLAEVGILEAQTLKYRSDLAEPVYDPEGVPRGDFFTEG
ncbi:MAG: antibiotic biosynthesis monooxygenase [Pseudomonadota bacterium]